MTTNISQPPAVNVLDTIFASAARAAVLRALMTDPTRAYYQRQIEAATGLAIRAVQRELDRLTSVDLLYRRVDGNRTYYQADTTHPFFPELRSMILKTAGPEGRLRGLLAMDPSVLLAFMCEPEDRALVVTDGPSRPGLGEPSPFAVESMTLDAFARALTEAPDTLEAFLAHGVDLLGRRSHIIWRHIAAAGFTINKGKGVP